MDLSSLLPSGWPTGLGLLPPRETVTAALVSATATLALIAVFARRLPLGRPSAPGAAEAPSAAGACDFLLNGSSVKPLSEPARALLEDLGQSPSRMAALSAHLSRDCPEVQARIEALVLYGTGFRVHCTRTDGSVYEVVGQARGGSGHLSMRQPSDDARALQEAQTALQRAGEEARFLRDVLDEAPVLAWSLAPDGQIAWANAAYRERFDPAAEGLPDHRIANGFGHVLDEVPLTTRGDESRRRVSVPGREDGEAHWYEICQSPGPDGTAIGYALEADDLVAAEASLRRFVETLTETFAHLPIGLAVFDKNRRLGLFNPALTDLVKIDAVWLAGRPSLRDFLERLRETRQMPEQKDFAAWRRKLGELEEGARDGTYEENWVLPSGKVFRVTGRPHPQGALAFLFEDISTSIMLERKYRSELELSQATLDRLTEAVAVFDASGSLVFVNSAFEQLWGLEPMERLDGPGVGEMTGLWAARCAPSPAWARLAEFATAAETRGSWTAPIAMHDGRALRMLVAPLPDASALVLFRDLTGEAAEEEGLREDLRRGGGDAVIEDLALEQIRLPVEAAVRQVTAAIPSVSNPEAFKGLSAAAQALRDGLARSRELHDLAHARPNVLAGPIPALDRALKARGLDAEIPADAALWPSGLRRAAVALCLAAADRAATGTSLGIAVSRSAGAAEITITAETTGESPKPESLGCALARRIVEAGGGRLEISAAEGRTAFRAALPEGQGAPAEEPVAQRA
ncbi:MAG TPA: PAS-domain containing protein [Amaricoccus sp.]|uniref:PAS-domain containing protein n=1 Tax=Amaricoccus sp. TaxID=1872485 RepID=UPI002BF42936|nr:PAS-domain containing protein [Amaricoccus sp.]HPG22224.1 PAS-domain containing protein [Amaricoccus sp.]HRW14998.1 PAS-domain containing protein [Amaricoccus sp.]